MYKLIIADDEAEIRNGLSQYFPWHSLHFEVSGLFENGKQVLDHLQTHSADVLLCDISMPEMDGLELIRTLRGQHTELVILLLSGLQDFEAARQAIGYNISSYIVKPTGYEELHAEFSRIKHELDKRNASEPVGNGNHQDKIIAAIKQSVESDIRNATLDNAASAVNMNADYVSKYFQKVTGQLFSDYVIQVRMELAAQLLQNIHYKTYEISEMVGYSYPKNFTRTFRKYYGMSPREYRSGAH